MRISDWSSDVCSSDLRVLRVEDVLAVQQDRAGCDLLRIQRVDTVEHAQQGGLAAARGPDQRGDLLLRDLEVDALERVEPVVRSEEHTSELQSLMRISYAVFCLKKKIQNRTANH